MTNNEQSRVLTDLIYLVTQMIHAERHWKDPQAVSTAEDRRFFHDAMIEVFLLSYRNLLDFFDRPRPRKNNFHRDSRATDFGFQGSLVTNAALEFERVSQHLAHLTEARRIRTTNEQWDLTAKLIACHPTLTDFFKDCLAKHSHIGPALRQNIREVIADLDRIGRAEPAAAPNGGLAMPLSGISGVTGGPPSVS